MNFGFFYDSPIWLISLVSIGINLIALELGFRLGLLKRHLWKDSASGGGNLVLNSLMALLGLILAFSFAAGVSRTDSRKMVIVAEANAIGTVFLRTGFVDEPTRSELRKAILNYAKTRVIDRNWVRSLEQRKAFVKRTVKAQEPLWPLVERIVAQEQLHPKLIPLLVSAMNDLLDQHTIRVAAALDKLPSAVVWLLFMIAAASLTIAGFNAGLNGQMSRWRMGIFAAVLSGVMYMIIDLDRPNSGFVQVSQASLRAVISDMEQALSK